MSRYESRMNCASRILALCLAIGILLAATPSLAKSKGKKPKPPKIDAKTAKLEVNLMKKLIDIDYAGLKLAKAADQKTTNVAILAFNQEFEARKQLEAITLQTWLKDWYKISYVPKKATVKAELESADEEDDNEFMSVEEIYLDAMTGVLHRDIAHAKQAPRKGGHPELKTFASNLLSADREELVIVKEMQTALEAADEQTDAPESD